MHKVLRETMPTSCQYKYLWKEKLFEKSYDVECYFMFKGLGIAQHIMDSSSIIFIASAFCYLTYLKNGWVVTRNEHNVFILLAWGQSGGAADYKDSL